MRGIHVSLLLASLGMMAPLQDDGLRFYREPKEPKNKFNLTDEDLELMSKMSLKEKKKFLKGRIK